MVSALARRRPRVRVINHVAAPRARDATPEYFTFTVSPETVSWRSDRGRSGSEPVRSVGEDPEHVLSGLLRRLRVSAGSYEVIKKGKSRDAGYPARKKEILDGIASIREWAASIQREIGHSQEYGDGYHQNALRDAASLKSSAERLIRIIG